MYVGKTLFAANETWDWRFHAEFAQCLIVQARSDYKMGSGVTSKQLNLFEF